MNEYTQQAILSLRRSDPMLAKDLATCIYHAQTAGLFSGDSYDALDLVREMLEGK